MTVILVFLQYNYRFFYYIFKSCNVGFEFSRSDLCCVCEEFNVKIKSAKNENNDLIVNELKVNLNKRHLEANIFYELQNYKILAKIDKSVAVLSMGYEKNFFLPITKVSFEYWIGSVSKDRK